MKDLDFNLNHRFGRYLVQVLPAPRLLFIEFRMEQS